jgi:hypothetical protein
MKRQRETASINPPDTSPKVETQVTAKAELSKNGLYCFGINALIKKQHVVIVISSGNP